MRRLPQPARHSYIAHLLEKSGATLKEAMQLARHIDPKLTDGGLRPGSWQIWDGLSSGFDLLTGPATEAAAATGTDGPYTLLYTNC